MCDHDPNDATILPGFIGPTQAMGGTDGILSQDELDELLGIGRPLIGGPQPSAPISPQEIVAYLREAAGAPPGQQSPWDHLVWRFAADAIEALTAENARLTSERDKALAEFRCAEQERDVFVRRVDELENIGPARLLRHENAELKAEAETLKGAIWHAIQFSRRLPHDYDHKRDFTGETVPIRREALGRLYEAVGHRAEAPVQAPREMLEAFERMNADMQELSDFGQRYQPETYATTDHGWYATHRANVEAAHAAAAARAGLQRCIGRFAEVAARPDEAEGLRPLTEDEIASHSYLLTRAKAGGIDMDLLGKLCREEPDADTKREVDEMMDGIKAMDGSPSILCHPEWPTLMAEALAQVKAGD
ncbi:hypothetical protein TSH7_01360 [Azospirillum sp. TSH7]|uniref:hypothetical protein n=1 Tax=unclassified Azospirillum TaxID=2630922 RepID=UPI000D608FA4|nr:MULTISPECIES: hypothetical protein [unclassified Azospirillum]PWC69120.1 hypothetical protein TSH7_01360 [Azospirillum sp. TSH7]PWC71388.1 hypothetical protein TSH20_03715 [Azospirillum sp. TSH20]